MKLGPNYVLVILKRANGLDHDCRSHIHRKGQKIGLGSREVKTMYVHPMVVAVFFFFFKYLTIHNESTCEI